MRHQREATSSRICLRKEPPQIQLDCRSKPYIQMGPNSSKLSNEHAPVVPNVAHNCKGRTLHKSFLLTLDLHRGHHCPSLTYEKRNETVALVHRYRLRQLISPQAQVFVTLDVSDFDEADQSGLFHRRVRLVGTVGHEAAVDLCAAHVGDGLLVPFNRR